MRILYVSHTHPPKDAILDQVGGMQRVSRQLIDEWYRCENIEVYTQTVNASGQGLVVLKTTGFLLKSLAVIPKKAREINADVILFSSMVTASLAWLLKNKIDIPMVAITHGRDVTLESAIYQKLVPHIFRALDGVISVSNATRQECIKRGMERAKGVALSNGFNPETMNSLPQKETARAALQKKFSIPLHNPMLLTVGRKVKRKGHEWFIREVLPKINRPVAYVTVGDGPELENVTRSMQESSQKRHIYLLGRQPDSVLKQAYAAADLFVMPNIPVEGDMEGFGIVLLEANMARTPAVASDLEGIKDVISTGKNGYKVPALNAEKFAETINELLKDNLEPLAKRTHIHVQNKFTWKQVAGEYIAYLTEVINRCSTN